MSKLESRKKYFSLGLVVSFATVLSAIVITACTDQAKAFKINYIYKEASKPGLVAKIGDKEVSREMVENESKSEFFELMTRRWELEKAIIDKMVADEIIGAAAKKAGMSQEDFLNKKILPKEIKITDKEYKQFVADKHIPEAQINPQIKERIMAYLQNMKKDDIKNAFVANGAKGMKIEFYDPKPKMVVNVEAGSGSPVYGKEGAPITIVEFSDFQCPFCSRGAETVTQLKKKYGSKVRLVFKHFPLPMHHEARPAAEASMCVNEQGSDKFWKFHDLAFKNQDKLDKANLEKYAKESGADVAKYNECVNSKKFADYIQKDMAYGETIGVKSTPTFFVNGQLISGAVPIEKFSEVIDDELEARK